MWVTPSEKCNNLGATPKSQGVSILSHGKIRASPLKGYNLPVKKVEWLIIELTVRT